MKKQIFLTVLVFALIISLSLSGYAEKVTLRVAWWGSQDRNDRTLKAIELFEEKYPDIVIEPVFLGWDGYWDKMATQAAGQNLPDVWQQDYMWLSKYVDKDLLLNLNPYVEDGSLDFSNVEESAISGGIIKGGLYGVNLGLNAMATLYDPQLFNKAGVEEPDPDKWTWEDYIDTAYKLHNALGIYADWGLVQAHELPGFSYYLRQMGKEVFKEDATGLGYEDDNLLADYFRMDLKLTKDGVFAPIGVRNEYDGFASAAKLFANNMLVMTSQIWSNQITSLEKETGKSFKMTILPTSKNQVQNGLYLKPSMFFSVTKYTDCPEEAVKFINFITNDLECNKILMGERGVPVSSEIRKGLAPLLTDTAKKMFDYIDLAAKHASKISPPFPAYLNEVQDSYQKIHEKVLFEMMTVDEAAKQFREEATKIINKYLQ
jgi:multiple sugar transport system substrate-binding protein